MCPKSEKIDQLSNHYGKQITILPIHKYNYSRYTNTITPDTQIQLLPIHKYNYSRYTNDTKISDTQITMVLPIHE